MKTTWWHLLRVLLVSAWSLLSFVMQTLAAEPGADPPARVGRISLANGDVDAMVEPAGGEWAPAMLNAPITTGSGLRTQVKSRAEVRVGLVAVQVNANTHLVFATLDDRTLVIDLERGGIEVQPHALAPDERLEVRADGARFAVTARGVYRIDHAPAESRFEVQVFDGVGKLIGKTSGIELVAGRQGMVDTRTLSVQDGGEARRRPFDDWAVQREERLQSRASRYVSAEMTGSDALDGYGAWRVEPAVGAVWYPGAVALDWAPYRYGRWVWVSPWGWTWVDEAPWGFAPFHYGRWLFLGGRWGWVPGPIAARPIYAPALVGFYGRGGVAQAGWTLGTGADVVGWFPLAPGEVFRPSYAASVTYSRTLNAGAAAAPPGPNVAVGAAATGSYRYAQTSFAATAVGRDAFGQASSVGTARVALGPVSLANAVAIDRVPAALPPRPAAPVMPVPAAAVAESARPREGPVQRGPEQSAAAMRASPAERASLTGAERPARRARNEAERVRPLKAWRHALREHRNP